MRKGIMALEGLEEGAEVVEPNQQPLDLVENNLIEAQELVQGDKVQAGEIEEAVGVTEVLGDINTRLQTAVAEDDGISAPVAGALQAATEHFQNRLGARKRTQRFPAMENFTTGGVSRKKATQQIIKQNEQFIGRVDASVTLAQEGFLDNVKYKFKLFFANEKKLVKRLNEVSSAYEQNGRSQTPLKKPPFAKFFNHDGKSNVSSSDVVSAVVAYHKIASNQELLKLVQKTSKVLTETTAELKKTTFKAKDEQLEKLKQCVQEATELSESVKELTGGSGKRDLTQSADYEPLTESDKKKLVSELDALLHDNTLERAVNKLIDDYNTCDDVSTSMLEGLGGDSVGGKIFNLAVDVAMALKKDVQLAKKAIAKTEVVIDSVASVTYANVEVCHASITYIALSTAKK